jgi:hypothetical protein
MPAKDVKAYVKRSKNDAADAEAICEAVRRPTMRFVRVKSAEQQARLMQHRTRDLLMRQRTQLINALRAHLAELGIVAAQGREGVEDPNWLLSTRTDQGGAAIFIVSNPLSASSIVCANVHTTTASRQGSRRSRQRIRLSYGRPRWLSCRQLIPSRDAEGLLNAATSSQARVPRNSLHAWSAPARPFLRPA